MTKHQNKLYIVGGPTASGKTSLALKLAKDNDGELVNADSVQVYRGMDIGANKGVIKKSDKLEPIKINALDVEFEINPFEIENSGIVGWMFDIVDPEFNFTVAHFQILALEVIQSIIRRGKIPIIIGGTGLYIDGLLNGYKMRSAPNPELRRRLESLDIKRLQLELKDKGFDLDTLNHSDQRNPRRLIRQIEKQDMPGQQLADMGSAQGIRSQYKVKFYYPRYDKGKLAKKIEERAAKMLQDGLIQEVEGLLAKGYDKNLKSMQSTGYRQVVEYLDNVIKSKEELIEKIALAHKQYSKRQITWFEGEGRNYDLIFV